MAFAQINKDNHLIWQADFFVAPLFVQANDDNVTIPINNTTGVQFDPFGNDYANYGFNFNSLEITQQDNPAQPATYDPVLHLITYYLPTTGVVAGSIRHLRYRWKDAAGNQSNEAQVDILVLDRPFGWRPRLASYLCEIDANGLNTGVGRYALLEKYYTDDGSLYVPFTTKANQPSDPDYVQPVPDPLSCPVGGGLLTDFFVYAFDLGINFVSIQFGSAGLPIFINHGAGDPQPLQMQIAPGFYDQIIVNYFNQAPGFANNMDLNIAAGGSGSASQATNVAAGPHSITFLNVTLPQPFGGSLILN